MLTPFLEITLTKPSKFDTVREPQVLWTPVITKSKGIVKNLNYILLSFLSVHLSVHPK